MKTSNGQPEVEQPRTGSWKPTTRKDRKAKQKQEQGAAQHKPDHPSKTDPKSNGHKPDPKYRVATLPKTIQFRQHFFPSLPQPPGPFNVGCIDFEVPAEKPQNYGTYITAHEIPRTLHLLTSAFTLFYPTSATTEQETSQYYRPRWIKKPTWEYVKSNIKSLNVPPWLSWFGALPTVAFVRGTRINALEGAPLAKHGSPEAINPVPEQLPIIVFSHGLGGSPRWYSAICSSWASYGFIVCSIEHRDGTGGLVLLDPDKLPEAERERNENRQDHSSHFKKKHDGHEGTHDTKKTSNSPRVRLSAITSPLTGGPSRRKTRKREREELVERVRNGEKMEEERERVVIHEKRFKVLREKVEWIFPPSTALLGPDAPDWTDPKDPTLALRRGQLNMRLGEVREAMGVLARLNNGELDGKAVSCLRDKKGRFKQLDDIKQTLMMFRGRLDLTENVAIAGHSAGGATAVQVMRATTDENVETIYPFKVGILLDPWSSPVGVYFPFYNLSIGPLTLSVVA